MSHNRFRTAAVALAGILIGIGGCTESPSAVRTPDPASYHLLMRSSPLRADLTGTAGATIGTEGGTLVGPGGITLSFPAGALSQPTYVSIQPSATVVGVEIQPHGLTFPAGAQPTLTLPYSGANTTGLSGLTVVYVDGGAVSQVLNTRVSTQANTLTATLPHFSLYAGAYN